MSSLNILNYKDIDVNEITFSNPEKVKGGSYISTPKYNSNPIYIQTPRLINKGLNKTEQRCSIELELDNTHLSFYEFITNIDDFNIVEIQKNSKNWFKQEFPLDIVEEFYKSPVKMARNKKAPSLKVKIPLSKGSIDCGIYNNSNQLINYSQIKNNSKILTVLHFYGLRFLKQQVICEWIPIQIKVFDDNVNPENNYLIDDSLLSDVEENELTDNEEETNNDIQEDINNDIQEDNNLSIDNELNLSNSDLSIKTENNEDDIDDTNNNDNKENILNDSENIKTNEVINNTNSLESSEINSSENELFDNELNLDEIQLNSILKKEEEELKGEENKSENENLPDLKTNEINEQSNKETDYESIIKEKNDRIEFLENKIRELYKYLTNN